MAEVSWLKVATVLTGAVLVLTGCGGGEPGTATTGDPVATVDYLPKEGTKDANPAAPVRLTVSNGTLNEVTLRNADGKVVKGNIEIVRPANTVPGMRPASANHRPLRSIAWRSLTAMSSDTSNAKTSKGPGTSRGSSNSRTGAATMPSPSPVLA